MTEILGYMQLGHDCCGYPFGELRDVTALDKALEDAKEEWWMAPFVIFYRKDGVFLCEEVNHDPDLEGTDFPKHAEAIRNRIKELAR